MKDVTDVQVIPGEVCVSQHKLVVIDMSIKRSTEKKEKAMRGRLSTWKLNLHLGGKSLNLRWGKS